MMSDKQTQVLTVIGFTLGMGLMRIIQNIF